MIKRDKEIKLIRYNESIEVFSKDLIILLLYKVEKEYYKKVVLTPELRAGISNFVDCKLRSLGKTLYDIGVMYDIIKSALDNYDTKLSECFSEYIKDEIKRSRKVESEVVLNEQ